MDHIWPYIRAAVGNHLRRHLEAREAWQHKLLRSLSSIVRSDATEMAVRGIMHIDTRVIEVPDFKTEVKFDS